MKKVNDELRRLKTSRNPLPPPPRQVDSRHTYPERPPAPEPMAMVTEEDPELHPDEPATDDDRFKLSPIPITASLPISHLPNRQNFRALTAEDSDVEDLKSRTSRNPYLLRSIDPIQIRPSMQRRDSNASMRHESESSAPRSIPRGNVDVHMASCSSSPNTSFQYGPQRDRSDETSSSSIYSGRSTFDRRPSVSSQSSVPSVSRERELNERSHQDAVAKLYDILDTPQMSLGPQLPHDYNQRPRQRSPDTSSPVTRNPSPVSTSAASQSGRQAPIPIQNSLLQRPALSRASTAAMQQEAERERARTLSLKESSGAPSSVPGASRDRDRDRERDSVTPAHAQVAPQPSVYHPRRPSIGSMRKSTSPTVPSSQPSGLSRGFWAMQEPQRTH